MERTEIDGVPVLWEQGPAPLSATLLFGCGGRDETFRTIGVTHLVEHLVMSTLPRLHHEHNAAVDLQLTSFRHPCRPTARSGSSTWCRPSGCRCSVGKTPPGRWVPRCSRSGWSRSPGTPTA